MCQIKKYISDNIPFCEAFKETVYYAFVTSIEVAS